MSDATDALSPRFECLDATAGLTIVDSIEGRRFTFQTPESVTPTPTDRDPFPFPVDSRCTVTTAGLTLPYTVPVYVRNPDGTHLAHTTPGETRTFPDGEYVLEFNAPVKLYAHVESPVRVEATTETVTIEFETPTEVTVGARSHHDSPAATITTTDRLGDVCTAVSALGSALKTDSCERSWPTLRGHPPRIERGDALDVPETVSTPETGVSLTVPREYAAVFSVAPLAYYLGADVTTGEVPQLRTDSGFTHRFDAETFETDVVRTLKQVFVLDCITRTEGLYPVELHEREVLDSVVELDFAALYDAPLGAQLEAYLSVPYETLAEAGVIPPWHRETYVRPTPENVTALPYAIHDFSVVRTRTPETEGPSETAKRAGEMAEKFLRRAPVGRGRDGESAELHRSNSDGEVFRSDRGGEWRGVPPADEYVPLPESDALEQAWVGDGTPIEGTKLLPEACAREQADPTMGVVDITVVCNDSAMRAEWDAVAAIYGARDDLPFDVDVTFDATTATLRALVTSETDVFHYIGHIDGRGFECADGVLDATTLETAGMTTFLLNACRSHDQGRALVEAGARAGIVSLGDVANDGAVEVGETLAKLLQQGFTVASSLAITRDHASIGSHYLAVGDTGFALTQCEEGAGMLYEIATHGERVEVMPHAYATRDFGMGTITQPYFVDDAPYYLAPGTFESVPMSRTAVERAFSDVVHPLLVDGELTWSDRWVASND